MASLNQNLMVTSWCPNRTSRPQEFYTPWNGQCRAVGLSPWPSFRRDEAPSGVKSCRTSASVQYRALPRQHWTHFL